MSRPYVLHPDARLVLTSMGLFCAYLSSSGILSPDPRISPPTFFTISLLVAAAALRPTFHTAIVAIAISIFAAVFLALDKIHGDCYYHVLWGKPDWGLFGRSDLEYYQQCVQGAQALWLMLVISLCWGVAVLLELRRRIVHRRQRIVLPEQADNDGPVDMGS